MLNIIIIIYQTYLDRKPDSYIKLKMWSDKSLIEEYEAFII